MMVPDPFATQGYELVEVVRKADLSFDGTTSTTQIILLATGISMSAWRRSTLEVIYHARNAWPATTTLVCAVQAVSLNPINPKVEYIGTQIGSSVLKDGDSVPFVDTSSLSSVSGFARVTLRIEQTRVATGPLTVNLSIRLLGRYA